MVFKNTSQYDLSGSNPPSVYNPTVQQDLFSETYEDLYLKASSCFEDPPIPIACEGFSICSGSRSTRSPSPMERDDDSDMESIFGEEFYVDGCNASPKSNSYVFASKYVSTAERKTSSCNDMPYMPAVAKTVPDAVMAEFTLNQEGGIKNASMKNQEGPPIQPFPRTPLLAATTPTKAYKGSKYAAKSHEESDTNDSEDEYLPQPRSGVTKQRGTRKAGSPPMTIPIVSCKLPTFSRKSTKRGRVRPPPRNEQATGEKLQLITEMLASREKKTTHWHCRICKYKQKERWMDFERHVHTHIGTKDWWCKGVFLEDAPAFYGRIAPDAVPYQFLGHQRIGGCEGYFSRRDALKRHLDNPNIPCIGWASKASQR